MHTGSAFSCEKQLRGLYPRHSEAFRSETQPWLCNSCQRTQRHNSRLKQGCKRLRQLTISAALEEALSDTDEAVVLVEIQGRIRRYFPPDGVSKAGSSNDGPSTSGSGLTTKLSDFLRIMASVAGFVLPKGFPSSVTDDYLGYQLRALPAHITGWMSKSLATSSLIHALGFGSIGPSGTVAASAAIKWITKDGIGAFGRFLVGGRLGGVFDEDPRRWRMLAVGFATVGLALEIATTAFPASFLVLAGAGNFTKAVGKGLSQPCFRIIQTHFALASNVGDISAKEEVWEVAAQLLGLASSVSLLHAIEAGGRPEAVLWVWALVQVVHVGLRYTSLDYLCFPELNQKRACLLVAAHASGVSVPGIWEANMAEPMLAGPSGVAPHIQIGVGVDEAFGGALPSQRQLQELRRVYRGERWWLIWKGGRGFALLAEDFTPLDVLRLLWQGAWLDAQGLFDASSQDYVNSLAALDQRWPDFQRQLHEQRWDPSKCIYRLGDKRIDMRWRQHGRKNR